MNKIQIRIIVSGIVAALIFTALFLIIPVTRLVIAGYAFCLLAVVEFTGTVCYAAGSTKKSYLTNTAFPLASSGYAILAIVFSVVMAGLDCLKVFSMPLGWFLFVQIVFAAVFIWRMLAMQSGQDMIEATGKNVQAKVFAWKSILADAESVLERTDAASRKDVSAVRDAIRFADPMSAPELAGLDDAICENLIRLGQLVGEKKTEEVSSLCITIQRQVRDRGVKAKLLK